MTYFRHVIAVVLSTAAIFFCTRAVGSESASIAVEIHPERSTVVLHQALDLTLAIHNYSSQLVVVDLGDNRKANIVLGVLFPDGTHKTFRIEQHEGLARIGQIKLQPGGTYSQPLLMNDWIELVTPGTYQITAHVRGPITLEDGTVIEVRSPTVVANVKDSDSEALTIFCDGALQRLLSSQTYADAEHAAEVLSYTRDPIAVPYLGRAFETPFPVQALLVTGLERIGTDSAIRVLLEAAHRSPEAVPEEIRRALAKLAKRTSDSNLQTEIAHALQGKNEP